MRSWRSEMRLRARQDEILCVSVLVSLAVDYCRDAPSNAETRRHRDAEVFAEKSSAHQSGSLWKHQPFDYNEFMARGWESKSVEEQMSAAADRQHDKDKAAVSASDVVRRKRKQGLLLERGRIIREMELAHKKQYLVLLERALTHIDGELAGLEPTDTYKEASE